MSSSKRCDTLSRALILNSITVRALTPDESAESALKPQRTSSDGITVHGSVFENPQRSGANLALMLSAFSSTRSRSENLRPAAQRWPPSTKRAWAAKTVA